MPLDKQAKSYLWDIHQAAREIKEFLHGVKFHEFEKNKVLPHSQKEPRYYVLGHTSLDRRLFIAFTMRENKIRVISARDMNKKERNIYEQTNS